MADPAHHMTIYTAPGCMRCRGSIRKAEKLGLTRLNVVDISEDALVAEGLHLEGYTELPVVRVWAEDPGDLSVDTWSGHRPDRIAKHAAACGAPTDPMSSEVTAGWYTDEDGSTYVTPDPRPGETPAPTTSEDPTP